MVPIFSFNFVTEIAKHVWRDDEMFRRHGVVAMEVVKFWGIFKVALGRNAHQVKPSNFISSGERKRTFPTGNGWHIAPPYKLLQSVYDSQEGV